MPLFFSTTSTRGRRKLTSFLTFGIPHIYDSGRFSLVPTDYRQHSANTNHYKNKRNIQGTCTGELRHTLRTNAPRSDHITVHNLSSREIFGWNDLESITESYATIFSRPKRVVFGTVYEISEVVSTAPLFFD